MHRPYPRHPVVTTLASAVAFALVSAPAYADIDRLQLFNGIGQPSVAPGTELSKGVFFDNQLIFAGTNLQSSAQRELHGANLADRAFTIDGLLGGGPDTRPVIGVTRIDEFGGSLVISHSSGVDILDPGALSSDPRTSGPINGQQSVQQAGNYYLHGNFTGGTGNDFVTLSDVNSSFQLIESDTQICNQSAAKAGSSTVVFLGSDNNLQKVVAPSTTPQPLFAGGITPPFTSPCTLASVDGKVVFHAFEAGTSSDQIYITDGTSSGTERLRGFNIEGNGTTFPHFQEFNGQLLFGATDTGDSEYGLWITDGSEAGTVELKNANAEISDVQPDRGFLFEGVLFFPIAQTLWQTDGTAAGTSQVLLDGAEINLEGEPSFTVFDEDFHFVATVNGKPEILRMANPDDAPEVITGITQSPVAIKGLGSELMVAADNNLFSMAREPVLSISSNTEVAENAGTGTVTVAMTLSETVPYEVSFSVETEDGDAIAGNDYIQVPKQTLTIPANTPQTTLTINLQNDLAQEETETFQVRISDLDGARLGNRTDTSNTGTVTITDSDAPVQAGTLQVLPAEVGEGSGNATVTVVTGGNSAVEITFDFTLVAGTATAGADFSAVSGSGSIAAGASSTTISIPVAEDTIDEPNESFSVIVTPTAGLSSGLNVALQPVNVTIIDNDDAPAEPVEPPASSGGGGGGGCSITSGGSNKDPMLPGLMLLALGVLFARRRTSLLPESNRA